MQIKIINELVYSVYILYSTQDYKVRYAGVTKKKPKSRLYFHLKDSNRFFSEKDLWVKETIEKGFEVRIKTIKKCQSLKDGYEGEKSLIKWMLSLGYKLVNSTQGGPGCLNPTPNLRKKFSEAKIGTKWSDESRIKRIQARYESPLCRGWHWNDESKAKMSKTVKGRKPNNQKPVLQFDLNNNFLREWSNISEAANFYGIVPSTICNNLHGRSKITQHGYWKFK
jgi:hypothetical protein